MSAGEDIVGSCCACCTLAICASIANVFNSNTYGSGRGSTSQAGCCGSCCNKSFDEDAFEEEVRKDLEKTRDPNAAPSQQRQQLAPSEGMKVNPDA